MAITPLLHRNANSVGIEKVYKKVFKKYCSSFLEKIQKTSQMLCFATLDTPRIQFSKVAIERTFSSDYLFLRCFDCVQTNRQTRPTCKNYFNEFREPYIWWNLNNLHFFQTHYSPYLGSTKEGENWNKVRQTQLMRKNMRGIFLLENFKLIPSITRLRNVLKHLILIDGLAFLPFVLKNNIVKHFQKL